jgi:WD40 repeat protein
MFKSLFTIFLCSSITISCLSQTAQTISQVKEIIGFIEDINCIRFVSKDNSSIACGTGNLMKAIFNPDSVKAELSVYKTSTGQQKLNLYNGKIPVKYISVSTDFKLLATSNTENEISIYDLKTLTELKKIKTTDLVDDIEFTPDNLFLVAAIPISKVVCIYDISSGDLISSLQIGQEIDEIAVGNSTIAVATRNKKLQLWSTISKALVKEIDIKNYNGAHTIIYSNDFAQLILGGYNGDILVLNSSDLTTTKTLKGHFKMIKSISISFDNKFLVSGSGDQTIKVWNLKTGKELKTITNIHKGDISSVAFSKSSLTFITSGDDKKIRVWKIQ